ncbi:MAG: hypothetical protein L3J88_08105 [Gammaproteobacteria bacterium]|nr:hypothetical protein [Gammaproteobacteria bacterium]MCF6363293.1 hypothetical protein [Gammaproteobacteria bacterium]
MSGIDIAGRQSSSRLLSAPAAPSERRLDGDEFARSLQRLESPQPVSGIEQSAADEPIPATSPSRVDALEQGLDVADDTPVEADEPSAPVLAPNDERPMRQDGPLPDAVPETLALHAPSPPGIAVIEPLPVDSATMTLQDFTALLERTGGAVVTDGEQAWRFMLHDSTLAVSQVALTREATSGSWSVALTVQGGGPSLVNPHLHRLRERLEALGQGVTHVIVSREETS